MDRQKADEAEKTNEDILSYVGQWLVEPSARILVLIAPALLDRTPLNPEPAIDATELPKGLHWEAGKPAWPKLSEIRNPDGSYHFPKPLYDTYASAFWCRVYNHAVVESDILKLFERFGYRIKRWGSDWCHFEGGRVMVRNPWRDDQTGVGCLQAIVATYNRQGRAGVAAILEHLKSNGVKDTQIHGALWEATENNVCPY